ncbi:MAG TPA: HAD-IA family hydrolase [Spirochaetia bacterium]|nr:HAD-IA family hydrolase [Spirochaetia bacterium]
MRHDLYIFDVGGVICHGNDVLPEIADYLGTTPRGLVDAAGSLFRDLGTGRIGPDRFWKFLGPMFGTEINEDLWYTFFHPTIDACVIDLISELRSSGNRVVAGTNTVEGHYRYHLEHGEYEAFDRVYASHHIGAEKPDPAFYRAILDAEQVESADVVFIDDRIENVAGAQRVGIRAVRFTSCDGLRHSLSAI